MQLAKSESGIQHAFDSKTLPTAKRYLDSAAALESVVVVSDLIAIVSTTAEIFSQFIRSIACVMPRRQSAVSLRIAEEKL